MLLRCLWQVQARGRTGGRCRKSAAYLAADILGLRPVWHQFRAHHASAGGRAGSASCGGRSDRMSDLRARYRRRGIMHRQNGCRSANGMRSMRVRHPPRRPRCGVLVRLCAQDYRAIGGERGGRLIPVDPISTSDYPTPATRPANSRLSTARLRQFSASAFNP